MDVAVVCCCKVALHLLLVGLVIDAYIEQTSHTLKIVRAQGSKGEMANGVRDDGLRVPGTSTRTRTITYTVIHLGEMAALLALPTVPTVPIMCACAHSGRRVALCSYHPRRFESQINLNRKSGLNKKKY